MSDDVLSRCLFRVRYCCAPSTGPAGWGCDQSAGLNYSRLTDKEAAQLNAHNIRERAERAALSTSLTSHSHSMPVHQHVSLRAIIDSFRHYWHEKQKFKQVLLVCCHSTLRILVIRRFGAHSMVSSFIYLLVGVICIKAPQLLWFFKKVIYFSPPMRHSTKCLFRLEKFSFMLKWYLSAGSALNLNAPYWINTGVQMWTRLQIWVLGCRGLWWLLACFL